MWNARYVHVPFRVGVVDKHHDIGILGTSRKKMMHVIRICLSYSDDFKVAKDEHELSSQDV